MTRCLGESCPICDEARDLKMTITPPNRQALREAVAKALRQADEQNGIIITQWEYLDKHNRECYLHNTDAAIKAYEEFNEK